MAGKDTQTQHGKPRPDARAARLKAALKANLARRKAQAHVRASTSDDNKPEIPGADDTDQ